jgi:RHS repeat-associated protein
MAAISDQAILKPENKFKYNGKELQHKEFSDGTGLEEYDYGARMYDLQLGRWGTLDPMDEGTPYSSPYAYVNDNPINRNDPNGMWWEDKKASDQANKIESEVNKVNSKIEARIHKQLVRADQQAARGNTKKALKIVAKIDNNQARVDINNETIGALHDMRDVPFMAFNFSTNSTTVTNTDESGTTTTTTTTSMSRTSNGVYVINNSGDLSNEAHEITHGGQVANDLVSLTPGTNKTEMQKLPTATLEVEAYKANFGITRSIPIPGVDGINDPEMYNKVNTFINTHPSN